jgi:hypothetical protein
MKIYIIINVLIKKNSKGATPEPFWIRSTPSADPLRTRGPFDHFEI